MYTKGCFLFLWSLRCVADVTAFTPLASLHHNHAATHYTSALRVSWWDSDDESRHAAMHHNIMRTDLRNFLTQRALQSFIRLCMECRDPHTVKWLEDFGGWKNLENFHGTGALNITKFPSWSAVLMDIMKEKEDVVVVSARRRGRGNGGWSNNNPYLEVRTLGVFRVCHRCHGKSSEGEVSLKKADAVIGGVMGLETADM
jgi:hypothetical protein